MNAFVAAARHLSFSKAAKELFVTQSAISRHIATLETYLGHALFLRTNSGLQITRMGATYLSLIRPALNTLESATSQVMTTQQSAKSLNLSAAPTFAAQWLFPRLRTFRDVHPDISINFVRYSVADYKSTEFDFDASIQYGYGDWPDGTARYLTGRDMRVVCSPDYLRQQNITQLDDIKRCTLLQHIEIPLTWEYWFSTYLEDYDRSRFGPGFNLFSMIIQAASSGFGVALIPDCLIEKELESGILVDVFARSFESPLGYYLCAPNWRSNMESYELLSGWLAHECSHPHAASAPADAGVLDCLYCQAGTAPRA
ncbi:transcriptional regulator [Bordetella genomosp. 1]|uniref:Transcriptional regulator n=1 Tax=Bordetella genomosp. 1 TaxID=1395607 RepID=A0A261STG6_9BORD|nr:LysR substrate-binding domain-containing protein [Bordetella genomosp. 1]MDQ8030551.1 LysR substrate-binding domain-containing protein [Bordetella sp.]OZI40455.1 transcriptional regulator [Bordetella genomosp. 1]OZI68648.1 transcriptional regulator [Bordetella genomosp. 1]